MYFAFVYLLSKQLNQEFPDSINVNGQLGIVSAQIIVGKATAS